MVSKEKERHPKKVGGGGGGGKRDIHARVVREGRKQKQEGEGGGREEWGVKAK